MHGRVILIPGLVVLAGLAGCREESDPPPRFMGELGSAGVPIQVFDGPVDRSIIASAASASRDRPEPAETEEPAEPPAERPGADAPAEAMEPKAAPADADDGFDLLITVEIALAVALGLLVAGTLTLALAGRKR